MKYLIALTAAMIAAAPAKAEEVNVYEFCYKEAAFSKVVAEDRDQGVTQDETLTAVEMLVAPKGTPNYALTENLVKSIYSHPNVDPETFFNLRLQFCIDERVGKN